MSNSIWKTPDQKPTSGKCVCIYDGFEYYVDTANPDCWDDMFVEKWCDFHDLIAQVDKAERLQKAVDKALDTLDYVSNEKFATEDGDFFEDYEEMHKAIKQDIDEIKQLIKEE